MKIELLNIPGDLYLIREGYITEFLYYQSLANYLDIPLCTDPPLFIPHSLRAYDIRKGTAPIRTKKGEEAMALAPQGPEILRLLNHHIEGKITALPAQLLLPSAFKAWLLKAESIRIVDLACTQLLQKDLHFSARYATYLDKQTCLWAGILIFILFFEFKMGFYFIFSFLFISHALFRLFLAHVACKQKMKSPSAFLSEKDLPLYTIFIPLYRESKILSSLLKEIDKISYPKSKLEIFILLEEGDEETRTAISHMPLGPHYTLLCAPHGFPRTKPRILQLALPFASGDLLTIYDAEDAPEADQLLKAATLFAHSSPSLGCLQAKLRIDNPQDHWLSRLFCYEYAALFDILNPALSSLHFPLLLGGTSNHFRTKILRDVGGWDAWNVTEDADLGLRLAHFGYQTLMFDSLTHEEAPISLRSFLSQRSRWQKGWIQTTFVHLKKPFSLVKALGYTKALLMFNFLLNNAFSPILYPIFSLLMVADIFLVPSSPLLDLWLFTAFMGILSLFIPLVLGIYRLPFQPRARWLWLYLPYLGCITLSAYRALYEFYTHPFSWAKTSHGNAKTSQRITHHPSHLA